ncbi:MAG: hypothetical protein WCB05_21430 [Candidatus Sulfotelmatobacter sp.]|jgi:hypothetical protein
MDDFLSEGHRRAIASGMLIADASAVRILDLLEQRNSPSALDVIEGSVSSQEKQQISDALLRLQALISTFMKRYDLQPSKKNLHRILASEVSQIWLCLEDSRPARIRGYGEMPMQSSERLEADLQEMLRLANRLRALLNS